MAELDDLLSQLEQASGSGSAPVPAPVPIAVQPMKVQQMTPQPMKIQTVTMAQSPPPQAQQPVSHHQPIVSGPMVAKPLQPQSQAAVAATLITTGADQMMDFGFTMLPGPTARYDEDGNTASDFKVQGTTSTIINNAMILILKGFNDQGHPTAVVRPEKYIGVQIKHSSGAMLQPWYRANEDGTLGLGIYCALVGDYDFTITLVGNLLFQTTIHVNPAGEELKWVTKMEIPQVGKSWTIDVVRTDGTRPKGKLAFEVETEGNLQNLNIRDMDGSYQVTCVPVIAGPVRVHIRLQGNYINGSPVELYIAGPGTGARLMVGTGSVQQGGPALTVQQVRPMNAGGAQPMMMPQAMMAQPMMAQPMMAHPMNANPNSQKPVVMQPMNPMVAQPMNARAMQAQPMTAQPIHAHPQKAAPAKAEAKPSNPTTAASSQGAADALADLLSELGGI